MIYLVSSGLAKVGVASSSLVSRSKFKKPRVRAWQVVGKCWALTRAIWLRLIDQLSSLEGSFHQYGKRCIERFDPVRHALQVFGTSVNVALAVGPSARRGGFPLVVRTRTSLA